MRLRRGYALALALTVSACGEGTGPARASAIVIAQGDEQGGLPGAFLQLRVQVLGPGGNAASGVTVTWAVTSGDATIAPASIAVDNSGTASAAVHLGTTTPGPVTVTASVAGVATPAVFALSNDPCNYLPTITVGVSTAGRLAPSDCQFSDGTAIDFYDLALGSQQNILYTMTSGTYRGYLFLFDAADRIVAATVDPPLDSVSSLRVIAGSGHWLVAPNAFNPGSYGNYSAKALVQPLDGGCPLTWVTRGIDVMQVSAGAACAWTDTTSTFEHFFWYADSGDTRSFTVDVTGTNFAATVIIGDGQLKTRATATAAGLGQKATATFTPSALDVQTAGPIFYIEIQGAGASAQSYRMVVH